MGAGGLLAVSNIGFGLPDGRVCVFANALDLSVSGRGNISSVTLPVQVAEEMLSAKSSLCPAHHRLLPLHLSVSQAEEPTSHTQKARPA